MTFIKNNITIDGLSTNKNKTVNKVGSDGNKVNNVGIIVINWKSMAKSKNLVKAKVSLLIPKAKLVFTKLKQAFVKAHIFHYFDWKCHIQIKTNKSGYAIVRVLSQLTSDNLG